MLGFRRFFAFSLAVILLLWEGSLLSAQETESLTLTGVVKQVLVAHPLTQASQARIQTASGMTRQAGAYANPTFAFELNDPSRERTYGLKQPLEWPFKRTYRIDIAKADEHLAESEQRGTRQDLIAVARQAFFQVLLAQEGSRIAGAFAATTAQLQESIEKQFHEGDLPEFDVTKAKVEALRAATDLEKVRGQIMTAHANLNLLLSRGEDSPLFVNGSLLSVPPVPPLAALLAQTEEQNPLLTAQRQAVQREKLNLKLAWASLVPDPSIDVAKRDNLSAGMTGPIVGLSFSIPLWDRKEGAIAAARSKVEEAGATLRATRLQLHQSLTTAYHNWQVATGQVDAFAKGLVVQAEEAAALAERSYQEGAGDLLGVLDAQRSLLTVRRDYAQALFDRQMAWVAIERAAGIATEQ